MLALNSSLIKDAFKQTASTMAKTRDQSRDKIVHLRKPRMSHSTIGRQHDKKRSSVGAIILKFNKFKITDNLP